MQLPHAPELVRLPEPLLDRRTALLAEALACLITDRLAQDTRPGTLRRLASDLLETGVMQITHDGEALGLAAYGITTRTRGSAIAAALRDWRTACAARIAQGVRG